MNLQIELKEAARLLQKETVVLSVASACELFTRFVTRVGIDIPNFEKCKKKIIQRGQEFQENAETSRQKMSQLAVPFIRDGATILIHGFSYVVYQVLKQAAAQNIHFQLS